MTTAAHRALISSHHWKFDAIQIIDALFPVCPTEAWDDLLDLRVAMIEGVRWDRVLNLFLVCRERLELDHYLPFFRLRRLLATSLQLEAGSSPELSSNPDLALMLARQPRSLADIKRSIRREWFEHDLDLDDPKLVKVRVVERGV
jgi:hypothetical protein